MRIIRAIVETESSADSLHRVKISAPNIFSHLLVDNSNGIYLRKNDQVYVALNDNCMEPLIIGRCSGQLELQDLVDTINGLVKVINANADTLKSHVHPFTVASVPFEGATNATASSVSKADSINPDDLLYK